MTVWRWTSVAACQVSRSAVRQPSRPAPVWCTRRAKTAKRSSVPARGFSTSRVPLLAADFLDNPTRVASFYDETGSLLQPPIVFQNAYVARFPAVDLSRSAAISTPARAISPGTLRWTANFGVAWSSEPAISTARPRTSMSSLQSTGVAGGTSLLGLANNGRFALSRIRNNPALPAQRAKRAQRVLCPEPRPRRFEHAFRRLRAAGAAGDPSRFHRHPGAGHAQSGHKLGSNSPCPGRSR